MKNCPFCGTLLHTYKTNKFCPNCDKKPDEEEQRHKEDDIPNYV